MMKPLRELSAATLDAYSDQDIFDQFLVEFDAGVGSLEEHLKFARNPQQAKLMRDMYAREKPKPKPAPQPATPALVPQPPAALNVSAPAKPSWRRDFRVKTIAAQAQVKAAPVIELKPNPAPVAPQAEPVGRALTVPVGFAPMEMGELTLNPAAPFDTAQKLIDLRAWQPEEGMRTWNHWQGSFWQWTGQCWKEIEDETVRAFIWQQLNIADKIVKNGKRERFEPKPEHVNAALDALRAATNVPTKANPMPAWLGGARDEDYVRECVALQNGIFHLPTRDKITHTPRFWSPNVLDFSYDPSARAPRFEQFLREIWPNDNEAQQCLLEVIGLCFTDITKYQKAFMFIGPRRGGRGTIGRVLKGLIGAQNYAGSSLKAFSEPFGMESLIGKKVAVFSDARLDGMLQRNLSNIVERLLLITGQDDIPVNRKHAKYYEGPLTARCIIFSNELLMFPDASGALPGRFITFRMTQSFYDREDVNLTDKLLAERPGIFNLALKAFDQLRERGYLIQPASGLEMSESLHELASDVSMFVEDRCVIGPEHEILLEKLYQIWQAWCAQRGIRYAWKDNHFSAKLVSAVPTIKRSRPRDVPGRPTTLLGIGLRKKVKK